MSGRVLRGFFESNVVLGAKMAEAVRGLEWYGDAVLGLRWHKQAVWWHRGHWHDVKGLCVYGSFARYPKFMHFLLIGMIHLFKTTSYKSRVRLFNARTP